MTPSQWRRLVTPLLADPTGWAFTARRCYRVPFDWVAAGVLWEGSATRDHGYVWTWSMPLFVPAEHVVLSQSARIGQGRFDRADSESVTAGIRTALSQVRSEAEYLQVWSEGDESELRAYSLLLVGRVAEAGTAMRAARDRLREDGQGWALDHARRIEGVRRVLLTEGNGAALGLLSAWRAYTASALRLDRT